MDVDGTLPETSRRWPLWPWAASAVFFLLVLAGYSFAIEWPTLILIGLAVLFELGLAIVMPVLAVVRFRQGQKHRALIAILLPVFFVVAIPLSIGVGAALGDYLGFYRVRAALQAEVDKAPGDDETKLVVMVTTGWLDSASGYVYDGSNEVRRSAGTQSDAWQARAQGTELEDMCFTASRVTGHFYSFSTEHGCDDPRANLKPSH